MLSVAVHGAAVAALVWRPDAQPPPQAPAGVLRLDVGQVAPAIPAQTPVLTPVLTATTENPVQTAPQTAPQTTLTPNPAPGGTLEQTALAAPLPPIDGTVLTPLDGGTGPDGIVPLGMPPGPSAVPPSDPVTQDAAPPADPRITELFQRIRDRLTDSCLFASPALLGDDRVQLSVFATDDRQISALMADLTQGLDTPVTEQSVLLDPRQCAALTFARRDPAYPAPSLSLQLAAQDIVSGSDLSGQVSGGAGYYTTLLLIDDQGVVHDLRRFLIGSATGSRFDIPLARFGEARDTHQLILALATTERPETVTRHAGEAAQDFFQALGRETGQGLRVGVASVYVR